MHRLLPARARDERPQGDHVAIHVARNDDANHPKGTTAPDLNVRLTFAEHDAQWHPTPGQRAHPPDVARQAGRGSAFRLPTRRLESRAYGRPAESDEPVQLPRTTERCVNTGHQPPHAALGAGHLARQ